MGLQTHVRSVDGKRGESTLDAVRVHTGLETHATVDLRLAGRNRPTTLRRMKRILLLGFALAASRVVAEGPPTSLTIYNQNFAVLREAVALDLQPGLNTV